MPTGAIIARFPRLQHNWLDVHNKLRRYVMLFLSQGTLPRARWRWWLWRVNLR